MAYTARELADKLGGALEGDPETIVTGIAKIEEAGTGDVTFLANPKYEKYLESTKASVILISEKQPAASRTLIRVADPHLCFAKLLELFLKPERQLDVGVHPTAVVGKETTIGEGCRIAAQVVIGDGCTLGRNVSIHPNACLGHHVIIGDDSVVRAGVSIRHKVQIGRRVIIQDNSVIGSDGFGFVPKEQGDYEKIPQLGTVIIEDDVEIGAGCTIDRATLGATKIERGVKLDNLIQVAHNVIIGANTVIAAQTGISGSTKIGRRCMIGGQVGFVGHIDIGNEVKIGAQSGVSKSFPEGVFISGRHARLHRDQLYVEASLNKLPALLRRINSMEKEIADLKAKK
ncbi:MAG: UDP-3-O-(3-hydroxymyristoyl)glucosamine N-acyltransferase [bacterium]|nr:UDP-3-O-(3-hydroxymyristoyl)glucosamine N-acyltransferase [bacterium]